MAESFLRKRSRNCGTESFMRFSKRKFFRPKPVVSLVWDGRRFTGSVMINFLRRLVKQNTRKIFLIVDGHPVHRSRQVKRWVHRHRKNLRLFYLPGYSPQLNPDELLNQDVKTNAMGRQRPNAQPEMMQQIRSYLRSTQHSPQAVRNYFKHQDVPYAAT